MALQAALEKLRAGQPLAALALLQELLPDRNSDPRLWYLIGSCRFELREPAAALEAFEHALSLLPSDADALYASALALEDLGKAEQALERYNRALVESPRNSDALHNRGLLLAKLRRLDDALQSHRTYVELHEGDARAHADLADVLLAIEDYAGANTAARRAIELDQRAMRAAFTAGLANAMLEQFAEAESWLQRARAIDPPGFARFVSEQLAHGHLDRDLDPRSICLIRGFEHLAACDWRNYGHYTALFESLIESGLSQRKPLTSPPLLLRSLALPMSPVHRRQLADAVARRLATGVPVWHRKSSSRDRLRIGYASPDFGTHPVAILGAPLFHTHDRRKFEVHAFSLRPDDGSVWRRRIESDVDRFHDLHGLSYAQALQTIRDANIDVLVDLAGATTGALPELFAHRAAPVQVSYLGFPGTSGAGFVDYLVCDSVCVPGQESSAYGEALVRLPKTFWICDPGELPARPNRAGTNLPEDAVVLYAHHPGQKITPEIFAVWMEILKAVPSAVLWLLEDLPGMAANLQREAEARGVSPQRLVFAPRVPYAEYRARIPLADLALDTPVYNGGATTLDALACGVPVLTCSGQGFAGRMAASALRAAGLDELVTANLHGYAEAAIRLARQRDALVALKQRVMQARNSSKLFDVKQRVRELEAAFQRMHARAVAGAAPESFNL